MKCRHAKKMISQYVDEELSPTRKRYFEAHIRSCAACRGELEEARALHLLFSSAERFAAPYGFAARVLANLGEKEAPRIPRLLGFRPLFLRAAQAALAVVVMTIGIVSGSLLLTESDHNQRTWIYKLQLKKPCPKTGLSFQEQLNCSSKNV